MKHNPIMEKIFQSAAVEWKSLGEVTNIKTGQAVSKQKISGNEGIYPVINSGKEPLGFIDEWNTDNDPIGITTRGAGVGSVTWQAGKYFRGNLNYSVTIKDPSTLDVRFLYHTLLEFETKIHDLCTFTGIPALNASSLRTLLIPIPPLEAQREIVQVLDNFTELTARKKQYAYYRNQLLNFEPNSENGENANPFATEQVVWKTLGEICDVRDGTHDSPKKTDYGKALITSKNIKNGTLEFSNTYLISDADFTKINQRSKVDMYDILFSMIGTVGEVAMVNNEPDFAIKNIGLIKTNGNELLSRFITYYLNTAQAKNSINSQLNGSAQLFLSLSKLRKLKIPSPHSIPKPKSSPSSTASMPSQIPSAKACHAKSRCGKSNTNTTASGCSAFR